MFGLHRFLYHAQQFYLQGVQFNFVAGGLSELRQHVLRVELLAVKAAVYKGLHTPAKQVE